MTPKDKAEFDQCAATLGDHFPPFWRRLYQGCIEQGFTEVQAMSLVTTYILSQCPYGIRRADK